MPGCEPVPARRSAGLAGGLRALTTRRTLASAAGAVVFVAACIAAAASNGLTVADSVVLGVVEGVTEFLPISSTGHLTVVERLLDIGRSGSAKTAADAYAICIQAGAILAVLVLYRERIASVARGAVGQDSAGRHLLLVLAAAFVPAAAIGLAFDDKIEENLFGVGPVLGAWAVGGVVVLLLARRLGGGSRRLEELTVGQGLLIGVAQALALWPGVSRSLVTILAALAIGLSMSAAVEFSFVLGLLTLGAATSYKGLTDGGTIVDNFGVAAPIIGLVVSFIAAVIAVRWMVGYLTRHDLRVFGVYRLAVAAVGLALLLGGAFD